MLRRLLALGLLSVSCGGPTASFGSRATTSGGATSRIEERALSDRPPLSVIEREGDPEAALAFASLAAGGADVHAALGEILKDRLARAGIPTQLVAHGLGFELMLLAESPERARQATESLLRVLATPIGAAELAILPSPAKETASNAASVVAACSADLETRRRFTDPSELERERAATFARDRSALAIVGNGAIASAVAAALENGPDWPELGRVPARLPDRAAIQTLRGERAGLSVALTLSDANRALGAATDLAEPDSALALRLAALGSGLRLRRVAATAHPRGACLRIDSDVDASPLPDARRLGYAIQVIDEEASLALARTKAENRLESSAVSAADPRMAARAAAYRALLDLDAEVAPVRLVALTTPAEPPLVPSIESAVEQARTEAPPLVLLQRVEAGQPGIWALVAVACASNSERVDTAGHAAVLLAASAAGGSSRSVRLEPWVGAEGVGILGFTERQAEETETQAAERLGDALGRALLAPPSPTDVASARGELIRAAGTDAHPLFDGLLEALAPGHFGALAPRGTSLSLQTASREAVMTRQRELLRLPHRVAVLAPNSSADGAALERSLARWLRSPDASRAPACEGEAAPPARGDVTLLPGADTREGGYLAFRIPAQAAAEANVLADVLNLPGGALARSLAEPDLAGAARAWVVGTSSARALIVQVSAFEGREAEALSRVQKLFERLASGGVLVNSEVEAALAKAKSARRLAALDPRFRLLQLLDAAPPATSDAAALRRLAASLRPEAAVLARSTAPNSPTKR